MPVDSGPISGPSHILIPNIYVKDEIGAYREGTLTFPKAGKGFGNLDHQAI